MSSRFEYSSLAVLTATSGVKLLHPGVLPPEVGDDVLPHLHDAHGRVETDVRGSSSTGSGPGLALPPLLSSLSSLPSLSSVLSLLCLLSVLSVLPSLPSLLCLSSFSSLSSLPSFSSVSSLPSFSSLSSLPSFSSLSSGDLPSLPPPGISTSHQTRRSQFPRETGVLLIVPGRDDGGDGKNTQEDETEFVHLQVAVVECRLCFDEESEDGSLSSIFLFCFW